MYYCCGKSIDYIELISKGFNKCLYKRYNTSKLTLVTEKNW